MGLAIIIPNADFSSVNLGKVTLTEDVDLQALSISGESTVTGTEAEYSVSYIPSNTNQRGVVWGIENGSEYASIDSSTGKLTIKDGASNSSVIIKATSTKNSAISATKTISVTYSQSTDPMEQYFVSAISATNAGEGLYFSDIKVPSSNVVIECEGQFTGGSSVTNEFSFGWEDSGTEQTKRILSFVSGNTFAMRFGSESSQMTKVGDAIVKYKLSKNELTCGSQTVAINGNIGTIESGLYMFSRRINGDLPPTPNRAYATIYSLKVLDGANIVHELQPYAISSADFGFYDRVTKKKYPISLSGYTYVN